MNGFLIVASPAGPVPFILKNGAAYEVELTPELARLAPGYYTPELRPAGDAYNG